MPYEGHKSVTVTEETYGRLKEVAKETRRSLGKVVEYMLDKLYPEVPA